VRLTLLIGLSVALFAYFLLSFSGFSDDHLVVCDSFEHTHTEFCVAEPELVCGYAESNGYLHGDDCFDDEFGLVCEKEETQGHLHGEECYFVEMELVCEYEESKEYEHGEDCFRRALTCGLEEYMHGVCGVGNGQEDDRFISSFVTATFTGNTINDDEELLEDADEDELPIIDDDSFGQGEDYVPEGNGDAEDNDAPEDVEPDLHETMIIDADTPGSEAPDMDESNIDADETDLDEEAEYDEDEEIEEDEEAFAVFVASAGSVSNAFDPTAPVATVGLPIEKILGGEAALEGIAAMIENGSSFRFEAVEVERTAVDGVQKWVPIVNRPVFSASIGGNLLLLDNIVTFLTVDVGSYAGAYFRIHEVPGTAGNDWIYDASEHVIFISVCGDTGVVNVYDAMDVDGEGNYSRLYLNGMRATSFHSRTPVPYPYIPPVGTNFIVTQSETLRFFSVVDPLLVGWLFELTNVNDSTEKFPALCADLGLRPAGVGASASLLESRDDHESILAFALFDRMLGAHLSDDAFDTLFGFGAGTLSPLPRPTNDINIRRGLSQYVLWFYELKYLQPEPDFPFTWSLDSPLSWPVLHPYPTPTTLERGIRLNNIFTNFSDGHREHILRMLETTEEMMEYYKEAEPGESITSLILEYDEAAGMLTVGYSGYKPHIGHLVLSWDNNDVFVYRGINRITSGSPVISGEELRVEHNNNGSVTFFLSDDKNYFLTGGSIRGSIFSHDVAVDKELYQRLITGAAEFVKASASLTIGGTRLEFTNLFTTIRLPDTFWLGTEGYVITGAILMLGSLAALFIKGVKPVQQEANYEKAIRKMTKASRRSGNNRFREKPRE